MTVECMSISALQFSQALAYLDTTQQEINTSLKSHGDMLKQVQSFTTHIIVITWYTQRNLQ